MGREAHTEICRLGVTTGKHRHGIMRVLNEDDPRKASQKRWLLSGALQDV